MTRNQLDARLLERICLDDKEAMSFLTQWALYVHEIDDIIDGDRDKPEDILRAFARAATLFAHPFYLRHLPALQQVVLNVTNAYADSVAWERSEVDWQRNWADHHRHVGMDMVIAVATLVGGYEHARAISPEQRIICWSEHHDNQGRST